jgi:hypothetical protein
MQIRRSPQAKAFFRRCCIKTDSEVLELLPYCKSRWGSWYGVLVRLLLLRKVCIFGSHPSILKMNVSQAVSEFVNLADDSDEVPNVEKNQPLYASYRVTSEEWRILGLVHRVLEVCFSISENALGCLNYPKVADQCQQKFSAEYYPTLWRVIPIYEHFIFKWKQLLDNVEFAVLHPAIEAGIESLEKYHRKAKNSPAYVISTSTSFGSEPSHC